MSERDETTTITLAGNSFVLVGRLPGHTKSSAKQFITEAGGEVYLNFYGSESGLIGLVGSNPASKMLDKIMASGLPIVQGDELATLLTEGEVELEPEERASLDELIGQARSLLAQEHDWKTWSALTELVDRCDEDSLGDLVAYLEPQLDRWAQPPGVELRQAPKEWLAAILAGDESPKYRLVHGVHLGALRLKDNLAIKIFETDQLPNWRAFDLGVSNSQSWRRKTFFEAFARATNVANLESLTIRRLKQHDGSMLRVDSMPALRRLSLEGAPASMLEGPWAPGIESLNMRASELHELFEVEASYGELRELRLFASGISPDEPWLDTAFVPSPLWGRLEVVRVAFGELTMIARLCRVLGEQGDALQTLDLSAVRLAFTGDRGTQVIRELLVETGLLQRLERVVTSSRFGDKVMEALLALDVEVLDEHGKPAVRKAAEPGAWTPHEPAEGEEARRAKGRLDVTDALLYERPDWRGWHVVVGVADGLRAQLDDAVFDAAMTRLDDALASWPDALRLMPLHWLGLLHRAEADPRLRLVRTLDLNRLAFGYAAKSKATTVKHIAESPHLGGVTSVRLVSDHEQKVLLEAYDTLLGAMSPEQVFMGSHKQSKRQLIVDVLAAHGLEPAKAKSTPWVRPIEDEDLARRLAASRHLEVRITSVEELMTLVTMEDLDHVVSLKLSIGRFVNPSEPDFEIPGDVIERAVSPAWRRLRWLEIELNGMPRDAELEPYARLAHALARWVSRARPVVMRPALHPTPADEVFALDAVRAGLYERAYGGQLDVFLLGDEAARLEMLGAENVRAKLVRFKGRGWVSQIAQAVHEGATHPVVEAMHPNLRETLKVLKAPLGEGDLDRIEDIAVALPELAVWCAQTTMIPERRDALLDALARAPGTRKLVALVPELHGASSNLDVHKPLDSKEAKLMAKGDGLTPAAFVVATSKWGGSVILSNYLCAPS